VTPESGKSGAGHGDEGIAIIGVSGRYPGAESVAALWENLINGRDAITEIPPSRWKYADYFSADKESPRKSYCKSHCKWGGFIDSVDPSGRWLFDLPPQTTAAAGLFLETVWNLFEDAGCTRAGLQQDYASRVGVFVAADEASVGTPATIAQQAAAYFELHGPCATLDAGSLVAVDMACRDLLAGNCQLAVAGGVTLCLHPETYVDLSQAGLLGSRASSRSFGEGDGFLPAEGVGAVLLKLLSQAAVDGDRVLAVIRSSLAMPSQGNAQDHTAEREAQVHLVEEGFRRSGIDPQTIGYVEASANGDMPHDAAEFDVLREAFRRFTGRKQFCPIGSVKANLGNARAASGMAQLSKVILQLQHRRLAPSIKLNALNAQLDFAASPFYLLDWPRAWQAPRSPADPLSSQPRRATVSVFEAGGTHVHLIVEEHNSSAEKGSQLDASASQQAVSATSPEVVALSAHTPEALRLVARRLLECVRHDWDIRSKRDPLDGVPTLADIAYTLQSFREAMGCRLALVVDDFEGLKYGLEHYLYDPEGAAGTMQSLLTPEPAASSAMICRGQPGGNAAIKTLLSGSAGAAMVHALLVEGDLHNVALYWAQGGEIGWSALHAGKVLRKVALPVYPFVLSASERRFLGADRRGSGAVAPDVPVDTVEGTLTAIWKDLFGLERIGRHQNFFELGGDSQLGLHMIARVRDAVQVDLPLGYLYEAPTVAKMSEKIIWAAALSGTPVAVGGREAELDYEEGILR
jgi:acyl transferase domain-containing protein